MASAASAAARRLCGVATLGSTYAASTTLCDAKQSNSVPSIRKRMTSIGRFTLKSETKENPSIPAFFLAVSGKGGDRLTVPEFSSLWYERSMPTLHPRFHSTVSTIDDRYFDQPHSHDDAKPAVGEDDVQRHATETLHTAVYRSDLRMRIQKLLTAPMDVADKLWEVQISSGPLGSSGAISRAKSVAIVQGSPDRTSESVLLFRAHHALADGVSTIAALSDLSDEAEEIRGMVNAEIKKRKRRGKDASFLEKLARYLKGLIWFCLGSIRALLTHSYLMLTTPSNPFDEVLRLSLAHGDPTTGRSISWCDAAPLDEVKSVAQKLGKKVTLNDVIVSCVAAAVARQLSEHRERFALPEETGEKRGPRVSRSLNVAIPVHLTGGILLPGRSVGNNIGAFVCRVPCEMGDGTAGDDSSASDRLGLVHSSLAKTKSTPAPIVSYLMAKFCSDFLPHNLNQWVLKRATANAAVAVSNGRGPTQKIHLNGRTVESAAAFLPLAPGIPIGIVTNSYAGVVSLSVTAEEWAVPDADKFLAWMLEEYRRLKDEAALQGGK